MDAQQLSAAAEIVLRQFGETGVPNRPGGRMLGTRFEHFVSVVIGEQGEALVIGAQDCTAQALAARMFDKPTIELGRTDWIDALGELCNMLAGKLAGLQGSTGGLGIPLYFTAGKRPAMWQSIIIEAEVWSLFGAHPIYFAVIAFHSSRAPE